MSIINRARSSAGATLQQGKSTLGFTLEQGKSTVGSTVGTVSRGAWALPRATGNITRSALTLARRQAYATVGASDAVVATITRQREELPARAKRNADRLAGATKDRVDVATDAATRVQQKVASAANDLTERSVAAVTSVQKFTPAATLGRLKEAAESGSTQAKDAYAKLAIRGEQVATDLRHDPVLVRVIRGADTRVENAANGVTSVAQKVRTRAAAQAKREGAATSSTPVRVTPASKVPAHRTTVRNTPAAEAAVSVTPTHRAAAYETATRQAAAKKAAATRRANALEATAKREAAVKKAAATRKKTAAAREQAAEARHAAGVKAAATRKKNAASA
jgi:hypothetical protein